MNHALVTLAFLTSLTAPAMASTRAVCPTAPSMTAPTDLPDTAPKTLFTCQLDRTIADYGVKVTILEDQLMEFTQAKMETITIMGGHSSEFGPLNREDTGHMVMFTGVDFALQIDRHSEKNGLYQATLTTPKVNGGQAENVICRDNR